MIRIKNHILLLLLFLVGFQTTLFADDRSNQISLLKNKFYHQYREQQDDISLRSASFGRHMQELIQSNEVSLVGFDKYNFPIFITGASLGSAQTIKVSNLWPESNEGYSLNGSLFVSTDIGIWDTEVARWTHQEFGGRVIAVEESDIGDHATLATGVILAAGIDPEVHGMANEASLSSYTHINKNVEILEAAENGMLVSNHSYVVLSGWWYSGTNEMWRWYGNPEIDPVEDYTWGFYSSQSQDLDEVAYNSPNHSLFYCAGNNRFKGPDPGTIHLVYEPENSEWVESNTIRDLDGGENGYDCISHFGVAKNIITVGAIYKIDGGYTGPNDVVLASFSSCGPTDDGRIKPELVAPGYRIKSTSYDSDDDYGYATGTSFATPALVGASALLQQLYKELNDGAVMGAATIKALLINTAEEAGIYDGPDYQFGWGLVNAKKAADLVSADSTNSHRIFCDSLSNGEIDSLTFYVLNPDKVKATIAWLDPPGNVIEATLDSNYSVLVNDLDMKIFDDESELSYFPWVLDVNHPDQPATTGDNDIDNTETVEIEGLDEGQELKIIVNHEGELANGFQAYSLVVSGLTTDPIVEPPNPPPVVPVNFSLSVPYPNPFNSSTNTVISMPESGYSEILIFDINGRQLFSKKVFFDSGPNLFKIDFDDINPNQSSGVYIVKAIHNKRSASRKLVLIN